ncbi:ESPR-type extended signal peptide-containing protein, partial [Negativicoccus succinicivorans]|uniref:ESPR-type extended signal peptide-containing protein n=1 Tax=Negativicoccus succinicivorans TaxID=620903 RepID=UPI0029120AE2
MNKIYKLIWSKVKNCWVVTSEMANSHVKSTSGRAKGSVLAASVLTVLLGSALFPADMVYAADGAAHYVNVAVNTGKTIEARKYPGETIEESAIDPDVNYDLSANPTINAISIGAEASAWNNGAVAMGFKTIAKGEYATALGTGSAAYSKGDLALGWKAYTGWNEPNKIAIGTESTALKENGISIGTKSKTWYDNAIAIGNEAETGNKGGVTSNDSIAIGNKAKIQGQKNVAIGSEVTVGTGSTSSGSSYVVAIGSDSHAYDTDSVVVGGHSEVRENAVVVGNRSKAGMQSVAVGSDIKAGEWSVAIGLSSKAKNHAIAMGYSSEASAVDSVALGNNASAKGLGAIAIGGNYDRPNEGAQAYSGDTIAIGRGSVAGNEEDTATTYNTVAIGREARAYGKNSVALGGTANVGDIWQKQLADGGTAIGSSANAALENATAIGYKSIAYAKDAVTLGANTRADIDGGVALGSDSNVGSYSSSSYGKAGKVGYDPLDAGTDETSTWKSTRAAVSVGNQQKGITRQIINVAAGTDNTDAVNVAQLKSLRQRAWKDLAAAKDELGGRIAGNTTSITALSGKVRTNTQDIGRLKHDVQTNDTNIRYLINNMPFMHYVSVKSNGSAPNEGNYKNDGAKAEASIAIGAHTASDGDSAVALGAHSFARGQDSVIVGAASYNSTGAKPVKEGQFDQSIVLGSNNTIFAQSAENGGREDKIIGNMNRVEESHGTFVRGTGNMVYDAYNSEALLTDEDKQKEQDFIDPIDGGDPTGLFQKGRSHVSVEGDGNLVGGALYTQVSGVGNEVSNSQPDENSPSTPRVTYNIVTGNRNTVVDSSHNLIMGDNHELEKVNGNIIIGSQKAKTKTEKSNVTILGNDANVSEEGGVALGTGSVASTAAGVVGYDPATDKASTTDNATWKSGNGAVSVGTADKTRQITNLAAGTQDTDAVNVAQLKNSKTAVEAGDYVTVTQKTEDGKGTTYTVKGPKLTAEDNLTVTDDVDSNKKIGYKVKLNKDLKGLTSVTSDAFKVGDKTYINSQGINANGNKITNVAAGAADGDAVNFKQLNDVSTQVTTNKNAIADLTPKVTTNTANIGKLQAGFIVKDADAGKADVTLGGDTKQEVIFNAAVNKTTDATAPTKSLTSSVDADRNVTYSLNINQLKKDLGITDGPDGVMSSWKLKVKGETTPQVIKNGNEVTFEAAGDGLTVTRKDSTIKYTIDGSKLDIAKNPSITKLGDRIDKLPSIHYFSVKSDDSANPDGTNWKNDGATGKNAIAIGKDAKAERESSVVVGLKASSGDAANDGVAVGSRASVTGFGGVAIGRESSAEGQETVAIGTGAKGAIHRTVAIGGYANADGFGAVSIGRSSMSKERGVSVGTQSFSNYRGVAVGETSIAEAPYAVAVGDQTGSYAMGAVTLGNKTRAFGDSSVAIGNQARVSGKGITPEEYKALPEADQKLYRLYEAVYHNYDDPSKPLVDRKYYKVIDAHDWRAENHYNSIAIGTTSFVEAKEAIGIGAGTRINGDRGVALGYAAVSDEKGTALGAGAQAKANAGVALGEGAVADTAAEVAGYDPQTGKASTETTPTWKSVKGAVSVGTANATRQITNLAAGLADTDAVNVAQLKALAGKVTTNKDDITTLKEGWTLEDAAGSKKVVKATNTVKVKGDDYITATVDNDGLKLGMNETKLNTQINDQIDNSVTVKAKMNSWVLKATSDKDAEKAGKTIDNKDNAVTFDATGDGLTVTRDGSTIKYGIDGSKIDIKGNKSITDLQTEIKESKTTVEAAANSQITVTPEKQNDKSTKYVVDIAKDGTIGGAKDGNLVTGETVKKYVDANKVTVTGDEEGSGVKVENTAADGQPANYKVSLGDKIKAGDVTVDGTKGAGQITGLSNTTWNADNIVSGRAATEDQLKAVSQNAAEAVKKHTTVVAGDYVTVSEGTNDNGGKEYTVNGPKVAVAKDEKNLVVGDIMDGDKKVGYELKLNKELTGLTSVSSATFKAGNDVTINNDGLTIKDGPSVKKDGIDAGGKTIANVADGKADTDAVNVRQLNAIASQGNQNIAILGGKVSELDGRVNRVGAGAAALAALHPLDFDPDDKWDFAAGYGNYSGANAVAIGAYYRPNE